MSENNINRAITLERPTPSVKEFWWGFRAFLLSYWDLLFTFLGLSKNVFWGMQMLMNEQGLFWAHVWACILMSPTSRPIRDLCSLRLVTFLRNPHEGHSFKQMGNRCAGDSAWHFDSKHSEGKKVFALPTGTISFSWKPPLMTCHIFTCQNIFRNVSSKVLENSVCAPNSLRWCWTF